MRQPVPTSADLVAEGRHETGEEGGLHSANNRAWKCKGLVSASCRRWFQTEAMTKDVLFVPEPSAEEMLASRCTADYVTRGCRVFSGLETGVLSAKDLVCRSLHDPKQHIPKLPL